MEARHLRRILSQDISECIKPDIPLAATGKTYWQRAAIRILLLPGFDSIMGFIILINVFVMVIDIDASAGDRGGDDEIGWTDVFSWVVLFIFVLELLTRLVALRRLFWSDAWNVTDFVVVTVDVGFSVVGFVGEELFPVSILRIFRLAKIGRVSKILRLFPELRMLLAGLVSSMRAIFWGSVLVGFFLLVWSMVAVLLIHPLVEDVDFEGCSRCSRAYSSVAQACLTFWQQVVIGDSWGQATIPVIEHHPVTILFFAPVFLSIGLALVNLMLGVVVTIAQSSYENDLEEAHAAKALVKLRHESSILELCKEMDLDHDGELSREEIHAGFVSDGEFRDSIMALGITDDDFEIAWAVLDSDNSGSVSYKEFVTCLCTMKSSDTQFMITYIKYYITWMKGALLQQISQQQHETQNMTKKMQETLQVVQENEAAILHDEGVILNKLKVPVALEEQELDQLEEKEYKQKLVPSSKFDESILQEWTSSHNALNPLHAYGPRFEGSTISKGLMSASADSVMGESLQNFGDEVQVLRKELKESWKGIDRILCQQISLAQANKQIVPGGKRSYADDDLLKGNFNLGPQKGVCRI